MVSDRALEVIAGVAAVTFVTAMLWADFSADSRRRWEQVRLLQYAAALVVLVCVIVLGVRGR